jgi:hypothetical protein
MREDGRATNLAAQLAEDALEDELTGICRRFALLHDTLERGGLRPWDAGER